MNRPVMAPARPLSEPRLAPVSQPAPAERPAAESLSKDPPPAWLLSPKAGSSVSGSFKALQEKQVTPPTVLTEPQSAALQDLFLTALRPILKDWLDQHLPGMVERMITAEIQRITKSS